MIKFECKKPNRIMRYFLDAKIDFDSPDKDLWCDDHDGKWKPSDQCRGPYGNFSRKRIRTLRAFKRYVKKHSYLPKGTIFRLCNMYVGYDVTFQI